MWMTVAIAAAAHAHGVQQHRRADRRGLERVWSGGMSEMRNEIMELGDGTRTGCGDLK